jgi:hypothetical protein
MNAAKKIFCVEIFNCMFHYGQMMWRNLQKHGLSKQFLTDLDFRLSIKMLFCCVFLPKSRFVADYTIIKEELLKTTTKKE